MTRSAWGKWAIFMAMAIGLVVFSPTAWLTRIGLQTWDLPFPAIWRFFYVFDRFPMIFLLLFMPVLGLLTAAWYWKERSNYRGLATGALLLIALSLLNLFTLFAPISRQWAYEWRREGLRLSAQQMRAIPVAIAQFKKRNGRLPRDKSELLASVQNIKTGMLAFPEWKYRLADANSRFSTYELRVETSRGFLNWDVFVFWPEQNYPQKIYGGSVELFKTPNGSWAYVHE